jgi:hypothetical protein
VEEEDGGLQGQGGRPQGMPACSGKAKSTASYSCRPASACRPVLQEAGDSVASQPEILHDLCSLGPLPQCMAKSEVGGPAENYALLGPSRPTLSSGREA